MKDKSFINYQNLPQSIRCIRNCDWYKRNLNVVLYYRCSKGLAFKRVTCPIYKETFKKFSGVKIRNYIDIYFLIYSVDVPVSGFYIFSKNRFSFMLVINILNKGFIRWIGKIHDFKRKINKFWGKSIKKNEKVPFQCLLFISPPPPKHQKSPLPIGL